MIIGIEAAHAAKPDRTGVEEYCWQVIQNLKKIIPQTVEVVLYSHLPLAGSLAELPDNWSNRVLSWPFRKGWSQIRLSLELLRRPPDVFFAPAQLVPFVVPPNTITMIHDSSFMAYPDAYWWASRWYLRLMNRLVIQRSKIIVVSAEFNKAELIKYYGVSPKTIRVIPLAFNDRIYNPRHDPVNMERVANAYSIRKKFFIYVGRLEEKKNTRRVVESFTDLWKRRGGDIQLILIGKPGVGYEAVQRAIAASPARSDIILPGYVGANDVAALFGKATALVFVSRYEGFGLPTLEAMASGCPVIAANTSALPEVGGDAPYYVNPESNMDIAQAMDVFLTHPDLRHKKIAAGLRRVADFSWQKTAYATWRTIQENFL